MQIAQIIQHGKNGYQYCISLALSIYKNMVAYNHYNAILLAVIAVLGLLVLASASVYESQHEFGNSYTYFIRQIAMLLMGCLLFIVIYAVPIKFWRLQPYVVLAASVVIIAIPFIQGNTINGADRWISFFDIKFQAAEVSRPLFFAFIAFFCYRLFGHADKNRHKKLITLFMVLVFYVGLLWLQPSYSTSIVVLFSSVALLFICGISKKEISFFCATIAIIITIGVYFSGYRVNRIIAFIYPDSYSQSLSYQALQAKAAIVSGGFFGNGLGNSVYKIKSLPEAHNDFILAIMVEELGIIMTMGFVFLFLLLLFRLFLVARMHMKNDLFASLFAIILLMNLLATALINIGFSSNLLPVTGLPFPLLSYGGSFMLHVFFCMAIAFRVEYEKKLADQQ